MARPCPHPDGTLPPPGQAYHPDSCRVCWLWVNDGRYRDLWRGSVPAEPAPPTRFSPCVNLGPLVERADCLCSGRHWYRCENPETSGVTRCRPGIECQGCIAYEADQ